MLEEPKLKVKTDKVIQSNPIEVSVEEQSKKNTNSTIFNTNSSVDVNKFPYPDRIREEKKRC